MPDDIQQKIRRYKKLGKNEERVYKSWKRIDDLDKPPVDRAPFEKPKEDYELINSWERLWRLRLSWVVLQKRAMNGEEFWFYGNDY